MSVSELTRHPESLLDIFLDATLGRPLQEQKH